MGSTISAATKRRGRAVAVLLFAGALLAACIPPSTVVPGTYKVGTTATSIGGRTTLRLVAVTHDSRCPVDVQCIWEGDLRAQVAFSSGGAAVVLDLTWSRHVAPTPLPGTRHSLALDDVIGTGDEAVATVRVI